MEMTGTAQLPFDEMTLVQKIRAIDSVIDDKIKEYLHSDGGDLDLLDIRETNGMIDVYITYLGACSSCSSSGGTLASIERILNGQLETRSIRVYSI